MPELGIALERLARDVDAVIIRAEIGRIAELPGHVLLKPGDLLLRHVVSRLKLASAELLQLRAVFLDRVIIDRVDLYAGGIAELRVLDRLDMALRHPFLDRVGAVADDLARPRPFRTELLDRLARHRIG